MVGAAALTTMFLFVASEPAPASAGSVRVATLFRRVLDGSAGQRQGRRGDVVQVGRGVARRHGVVERQRAGAGPARVADDRVAGAGLEGQRRGAGHVDGLAEGHLDRDHRGQAVGGVGRARGHVRDRRHRRVVDVGERRARARRDVAGRIRRVGVEAGRGVARRSRRDTRAREGRRAPGTDLRRAARVAEGLDGRPRLGGPDQQRGRAARRRDRVARRDRRRRRRGPVDREHLAREVAVAGARRRRAGMPSEVDDRVVVDQVQAERPLTGAGVDRHGAGEARSPRRP